MNLTFLNAGFFNMLKKMSTFASGKKPMNLACKNLFS